MGQAKCPNNAVCRVIGAEFTDCDAKSFTKGLYTGHSVIFPRLEYPVFTISSPVQCFMGYFGARSFHGFHHL